MSEGQSGLQKAMRNADEEIRLELRRREEDAKNRAEVDQRAKEVANRPTNQKRALIEKTRLDIEGHRENQNKLHAWLEKRIDDARQARDVRVAADAASIAFHEEQLDLLRKSIRAEQDRCVAECDNISKKLNAEIMALDTIIASMEGMLSTLEGKGE